MGRFYRQGAKSPNLISNVIFRDFTPSLTPSHMVEIVAKLSVAILIAYY